jgi:hypothetical protein
MEHFETAAAILRAADSITLTKYLATVWLVIWVVITIAVRSETP